MKLRKLVLLVMLGCGIASLGACSTMHHNDDNNDESSVSDASNSSDAKTVGLNQGDNFNGQGTSLSKNTYYFDFDKSDIRSQDKPAIEANANKLASNPGKKVVVEGHTDPRGSREYNIALGERRANSVAEVLKSQGANPSQVRVVSYGAQRLAATGRDESAYKVDRRAVLDNETSQN